MPLQREVGDFFSAVVTDVDGPGQSDPRKKRKPDNEHEKDGRDHQNVEGKAVLFPFSPFFDVSEKEKKDQSKPGIVGPVGEVVDLNKGGKNIREIEIEVAQVDEKFTAAKRVFVGCRLIKERGVKETEHDNEESDTARCPKKQRIDFLLVVDQEIANQKNQNPGNGGQHTALRAVALAVGKKSIVEDKGEKEKKENKEFFFSLSECLDQTEKSKKVEGRIEEESVPLIEEVIEERVYAKQQRDVEDDLFEVLHNFRCEHAFVNGDGIVGSVKCVDIYVKENQRENGKGHKGQNFQFGFVFFEDVINADEKERKKDHIVLEAEPDEKGEDKAEKHIVERRKWALLPDFPEQINGEKGDGDGRVEVKGKKENRNGKAVQKPEDKRQPFPSPEVIGQKKNL